MLVVGYWLLLIGRLLVSGCLVDKQAVGCWLAVGFAVSCCLIMCVGWLLFSGPYFAKGHGQMRKAFMAPWTNGVSFLWSILARDVRIQTFCQRMGFRIKPLKVSHF